MNSISWFLYLADVIPSLAKVFGVSGIILSIILVIAWFICLVSLGDSDFDGCRTSVKSLSKWLVPVAFTLIIIATIIPSRQTIYLIAGSEVGQVVVETPEAREIFNDIRTIIKQQIKGQEK